MSYTLLRKKAQMQMFETIGVLFVFFILLAFGLIFYAGFQKDSTQSIQDDDVELRLVSIAQTISGLPEIKCSEQDSIDENCYDLLSLEVLSSKMNEFMDDGVIRNYFTSMFDYSNITIDVFYEKNRTFKRYPLYYENSIGYKNIRTNYVPITIIDSRDGEYYFGVLYLSVFVE